MSVEGDLPNEGCKINEILSDKTVGEKKNGDRNSPEANVLYTKPKIGSEDLPGKWLVDTGNTARGIIPTKSNGKLTSQYLTDQKISNLRCKSAECGKRRHLNYQNTGP